jgi:hypothetical protein
MDFYDLPSGSLCLDILSLVLIRFCLLVKGVFAFSDAILQSSKSRIGLPFDTNYKLIPADYILFPSLYLKTKVLLP